GGRWGWVVCLGGDEGCSLVHPFTSTTYVPPTSSTYVHLSMPPLWGCHSTTCVLSLTPSHTLVHTLFHTLLRALSPAVVGSISGASQGSMIPKSSPYSLDEVIDDCLLLH